MLDTAEQQREAAEEYIAHIAQKGVPKPNWWKEFLQQIRMFFRRFKWAEDAVLLDSQIETVLARAARKVRKGTAKKNLAVGEGVRYSVIGEEGGDGADKSDLSDELRYYDIPWKEGLYKAVTDKSVREPVFVSETPEVLIKIGFTAMPMLMNVRHLRLNYYAILKSLLVL